MSEPKKEEDNQNQNNQMKDTSNNINDLNEKSSANEKEDEIIEKDIEKEEMNFDSIDFNINPFNSKNSKSDDKNDQSGDLVLEEKEDDIFNLNKLNFNPKFHTSNDLPKIDFLEESPKEIDFDKNKDKINDLFIDKNNNNINLNNNSINDISSMNTNNNSRKSYNNSNNLKLDLEANSFIPKNRNMNDNLNNFFMAKGRTSWVCSFCHNFNYESKKYILFNI